jgi:hypothetical protein
MILIVGCTSEQSDLSPLLDQSGSSTRRGVMSEVNAAYLTDVKAVNADHISKEMMVNAGPIDPENHVNAGNMFLVNPLSLNRGNSVLCVLARALLLQGGLFN